MAKYTDACDTSTASGNIATGGINSSPTTGRPVEAFWSSESFSFASYDAAKVQSNWDAGVASGDLIYLGEIEATDNSEEREIFENKNLGIKFTTESATKAYNFVSLNCACTHAELSKMSGRTGRLFLRTKLGFAIGRANDDGTVQGQPIGELYVGFKQLVSDDNPGYTPMEATFSDPEGDDRNPYEGKIDFQFSEVDQVFKASGAVSNVIDVGPNLTFDVTLTKECSDGSITGSVAGDWKAYDVNGTELTINSVSESSGVYSFDVQTTETLLDVQLDGIRSITNVLYISDKIRASV